MSSTLLSWMLQSRRPLTATLLHCDNVRRITSYSLPSAFSASILQSSRRLRETCKFHTQKLSFHSSATLLKDKTNKGDVEEMDDLQKNPYFNKYADKIAKMQKTSPEEFLNRLAEFEKKKKKSSSPEGAQSSQEKNFSLPTKPKRDISPGSVAAMTKEKKLNDIMKVDLLEDKSAEEIGKIWRDFHLTKDSISAVIPKDVYKQMAERFIEYKTFLFPLPRKQGYEFIVVQFLGNGAHFTTLINFQAHAENAPECLTLTHYTDLADDKGIVLMVGEYDPNVLVLGSEEVHQLSATAYCYLNNYHTIRSLPGCRNEAQNNLLFQAFERRKMNSPLTLRRKSVSSWFYKPQHGEKIKV